MAITLAYIYGNKNVLGQGSRKVTFTGSPQTDGYVYFNDDMFYRCPVPNGDQYNHDYNLSNVQIWYPVRNCWVRADYFTNLKLRYFPLGVMYDDIQDLKTRMTAVEGRCTALENILGTKKTLNPLDQVIAPYTDLAAFVDYYKQVIGQHGTDITSLYTRTNSLLTWLNQLGKEAIGDGLMAVPDEGNGEILYRTISSGVNELIDYMNIFHSLSIPRISASVYTDWNARSF